MGNSQTFMSDIEFVRTIDDQHFGQVELYRRNDIEYIMKKTFTFVYRDSVAERLLKHLNFMQKVKHLSLPPIHHIEYCNCTFLSKVEKQLCI
jgi:hypothetical protein